MDTKIYKWYRALLDDLSELGVCYEDESVPINPLILDKDIVNSIASDLPKLANLARKVSIEKYIKNQEASIRSDYLDVISLYIEKKRQPIIMRADAILVDQQLRLLELNIDSGLGGIWEVDFMQKKFLHNPIVKKYSNYQLPSPKSMFLELIIEAVNSIDFDKNINLALIGRKDFDQYYKDQAHELCKWIKDEVGINAFFCYPEMLRNGGQYITDGNRDYHILYRDSSVVHSKKNVEAILELLKKSASTKSIVLSDPIDLLIEHKEVLSTLYEEANKEEGLLTKIEKQLVMKYIPQTISLSGLEDKKKVESLLCSEKNRFVLKRCCSHAGEYVYIGEEQTQERWDNLVKNIINNSSDRWIYQENLKSNPYKFEYISKKNEIFHKKQRYTLSPFLFGNHLGGFLVRIEKDDKHRVLALPINSDMGSTGVVVL